MMWTDRRWGPGVDRLGFGPDIGIPAWRNIDPLPGHGLPDVVLNTNKNLFMASLDLFGWAAGSLVLVAWWAVAGRRDRRDLLHVMLVGAFVLGHTIYWFSGGPDLGPRYWYPIVVSLIVLTLRGAQDLGERLGGGVAPARIGFALAGATLGGLFLFIPWRAATKYYHYRDVGGEVRQVAQQAGIRDGLVFIRSGLREDYQSAFNLNPRTLSQPGTIYARYLDAEHRARVVRAFASRPVWVLFREADPAQPLVVEAGPLPPGTVP
jgi:hypothetical protein